MVKYPRNKIYLNCPIYVSIILNGNALRSLLVLLILVLVSCGESNSEKELRLKIQSNKQKFYYPEPYDDWWRNYWPRLTGAEGWVKVDCQSEGQVKTKVYVDSQNLTHKSWGYFNGTLVVKTLDKSNLIIIDLECFEPDFEKGDWLNKPNK